MSRDEVGQFSAIDETVIIYSDNAELFLVALVGEDEPTVLLH